MNLTNERAIGLKEQEKLEVQLVEPLTKLQLLEDIQTERVKFINGTGHRRNKIQNNRPRK